MKTLEEKIKEIRDLSKKTIWELGIYNSLKENYIYKIKLTKVYNETLFDISDDDEYNHLKEILQQNQKQPELYTLDEIIRIINNASVMYSHDDNYIIWLKELKRNIVTYKKLD